MVKQFNFLVAASIFFQMSLAGAQGATFEKEVPDQSSTGRALKVEFKANTENPELGRAWLFAYYDQPILMDADGPIPASSDIMVPGLSYVASTKQIIYKKADGSSVVCADNVATGIFQANYRETGKCNITLSKTIVSQDNGFVVKKLPGIKITLSVHE